MGVVTYFSHKLEIQASRESVFGFLNDLNNLKLVMPDQIINWQSDDAQCSFDIKGMAHIMLEKADVTPGKLVRILSKPENPVELEFRLNIEGLQENQSIAWIELDASLSPIFQMMASAPLQNLVNIMVERLKVEVERRA